MDMQQSSEIPLPNPGGQVAERIPLFRLGANRVEYQTETGRISFVVWCDSNDVARVLAKVQRQGVALPIYKGHRKRDAEGKPLGDDERESYGWMRPEASADGGIDAALRFGPDGLHLVSTGKYGYDSPEIMTVPGPDGRLHLDDITATALVNQPARSGSRPLVMQTMSQDLNPTAKKLQDVSAAHAQYMKTLQALADSDGEAKAFADNMLGGLAAPQTELRRLCESLIPQQAPEGQAQAAEMSAQSGATPAAPALSAEDAAALKLGRHVQASLKAASADEAMGVFDNLLPTPAALSASQGEVKELLIKEGLQSGVFKLDQKSQLLQMSADYLRGRLRPLGQSRPLNLGADERSAKPSPEARSEGQQADADAKKADDEIDRSINRQKIGGSK